MPLRLRNLIKDYLQAQLYKGENRITVSEDVRPILRAWIIAARKGVIAPTQVLNPPTQVQETPANYETSDQEKIVIEIPDEEASARADITIPYLSVPLGDRETQILFILNKAQEWLVEAKIQTLRNKLIFSAGNLHADVMVVNEFPSYLDEKNNNLLTGPAGDKFTQILKAMGLNRTSIYLTNLVKYRPNQDGQSTNTRPPTPLEKLAFAPFIKAEAEIIKPKVILVLGDSSAQTLLNNEASLSEMKGEVHDFYGSKLVATYHPSYLLQSDKKEDKRSLWEDMLLVMEQAELPISEKQRQFFL